MNKIFNGLTNLPQFFQDLSNCYNSELESIDDKEAENAVIYGTPCYLIENNEPTKGIFFLSEETSDYICFANKDTTKITRLSIKSIRKMQLLDKSKNLGDFKFTSGNEYIQITIWDKTYDFGFLNHKNLLLVIKGLLSIFQCKKIVFEENMDNEIFQIANKYDTNFDQEYDYEEFKGFAKEIGVKPKILILDGQQFAVLFRKYAIKKNEKEIITPMQLKKFFHEIQNEKICDLEAYQLIIHYSNDIKDNNIKRIINKKFQNSYRRNDYKINEEEIRNILDKIIIKHNTNVKLELTLREFTHMLNSLLLTVYQMDKILNPINMILILTKNMIMKNSKALLKK